MAEGSYTVMHLDLASLDSVRHLHTPGRTLDHTHLTALSVVRPCKPQMLKLPCRLLRCAASYATDR